MAAQLLFTQMFDLAVIMELTSYPGENQGQQGVVVTVAKRNRHRLLSKVKIQ